MRDLAFALEAVVGSGSSEEIVAPMIDSPSRRWPKAVAVLTLVVAAAIGGLLAGF